MPKYVIANVENGIRVLLMDGAEFINNEFDSEKEAWNVAFKLNVEKCYVRRARSGEI